MRDESEIDTVQIYFPTEAFQPGGAASSLSSRVRIDLGGVSHVGNVRKNNEDAYLIYRQGRFWQKVMTNLEGKQLPDHAEENAYVMAVADGIGGMAAGEVASSTAITTLVNLVLSSGRWALKVDQPETREQEIQEAMARAINYLNKADLAIAQRSKSENINEQMGTTLTAAYIVGDDLFIMHIGDSRAYLFRRGTLTQLTHDHTFAQALADSGAIPASEVEHHRFRHVLTKAVGLHDGNLDIEFHRLKLLDGDILLLCSDGLSDWVPNEVIAKALASKGSAQEKCDELLDQALTASGKDNITVLIGDYRIA